MRLARFRKAARITVGALLLAGLAIGGPIALRRSAGNFGTVEPGRVFRSAQLGPESLRRAIREHGIKTVLNLRGPNPDQAWYRDEVAATVASGAAQVDVPLASDQWLSHDQVATLLDVLGRAEYPILIHCEFGAERTGLVSAFVELLKPGGTLDDARSQFSIRYLFIPFKDGLVMLGHLDRYESWLRDCRLSHTPDQFRRWLATDYRPDSPSREYWPCNPYPRKVVTRVGPDGSTETSSDLPRDACPKTVATRIERDDQKRD